MAPPWALALLTLAWGLVHADAMYSKNSPVLQVTAKTYGSLIAQSNHTSIVEFYAPWCGHCKNLKPAYEKAAKNLAGLAKVAAVDCDDEANKPLCSEMGVQGFPTLKIVKPGTKRGRPVVEDYQGPRTTKAIVEAVVGKIPNHVKKLQDSDLDVWLADTTTKARAILFTEKGTTSSLIRSLAIDFLGTISVAQIRSKEEDAVEKYGITEFPSIVLLPGEGQDPIVYAGEMKKEPLVKLFSQIAPPNSDSAPGKVKSSKAKDSKSARDKSASASFSQASETHKSSDLEDFLQASTIILDDDTPTESPLPIVDTEEKPMVVLEVAPAIPQLSTPEELDDLCLAPRSGTCILVLLPATASSDTGLPESATQALTGFAEISDKHSKRRDHTFPFYGIPATNERANTIRGELGIQESSALEIIAINNKRRWWRHYSNSQYDMNNLENFVDAIKLGEGEKSKLPDGFGAKMENTSASAFPEPTSESDARQDSEPIVVDESPVVDTESNSDDRHQADHDEL